MAESAPKKAKAATDETRVRVTTGGKMKHYCEYALGQLDGPAQAVTLDGSGKSITKTVSVAELLKRKRRLEQETTLSRGTDGKAAITIKLRV